jgi:uncharacterized protein (TIGR03083 family)
MNRMETAEHIGALAREGELLAAAAERADLVAEVPSCPGWQVRDLLRHISYVHRWAAGYVRDAVRERVPRLSEPELLRAGPADDELIDWFRAGHAALVETLFAAPPGLECWSFLAAPSAVAFWARRQAHETAIHRADAELVAGDPTEYDPEFAADGIDELLTGFLGRGEQDRSAASAVLRVRPADAGQEWHVWLAEGGRRIVGTARGSSPASVSEPGTREPGTGGPAECVLAECVLAGPASALYLLLWNRCPPSAAGLRIDGDADLIQAWQAAMHVAWR